MPVHGNIFLFACNKKNCADAPGEHNCIKEGLSIQNFRSVRVAQAMYRYTKAYYLGLPVHAFNGKVFYIPGCI